MQPNSCHNCGRVNAAGQKPYSNPFCDNLCAWAYIDRHKALVERFEQSPLMASYIFDDFPEPRDKTFREATGAD